MPASLGDGLNVRPDDPRLGEFVTAWDGDPSAFRAGRPVLVGFPQDEGVRRNRGRPGCAAAPPAIRRRLYNLVPFDPEYSADLAALGLLDVGDLLVGADLEASQALLGEVVADLLRGRCVPIILGGGHETALGTYLGYVAAGVEVAVVNLDAHLDVRPTLGGKGHSGSPFRQMMEHAGRPLPGARYACLGAQPSATSREHLEFVRTQGGAVAWASQVSDDLAGHFEEARERFVAAGCRVHVSLDADVVRAGDVPGVSAPAASGLSGDEVLGLARAAGAATGVSSFELVEVSPPLDAEDRSARWAALAVWHFLAGLAGERRAGAR